MALNEDTVHLLLFWEHPSSPGANTSRGCHAARFTDREGRVSERSTPRLASRPQPGGEGRPGSAGVGGRRLGAGRRPGMSSAPPGVARRLHQTPRGAPARDSSREGPSGPSGRRRPGRARSHASSRLGRGLLLLHSLARPPRPPYLRLRPARPQAASTPSGPERPDPTRPDPGLPARESARRSDDYETGCLRPFRRRGHRLPLLAGTARAAAASTTNESTGLRATHSSLATGSATSQSQAV